MLLVLLGTLGKNYLFRIVWAQDTPCFWGNIDLISALGASNYKSDLMPFPVPKYAS